MTALLTERDRKRLSEIIAIVRPKHSLKARLKKLSSEQLASYNRWEARYDEWIERRKAQCPEDDDPDAYIYARSLEEENGKPKLRRDVRIALHGPDLTLIPITASEDDAARIYKEFCDDQSVC